MEEVLKDIRALLLIERARMHRNVTDKTPESEIIEQIDKNGTKHRLRKWDPALKDALDEVADVNALIAAHRGEPKA